MTPESKNQLQCGLFHALLLPCSAPYGQIYIGNPPLLIKHTQHSTVSNMNPPKYPYLFLVFFLCFRLNFSSKVLNDGDRFLEDNDKEKKNHFGNIIKPAKFGAGMGMQLHEDIEKERRDHFGNMIFPSKLGDGMGMRFHEDIEKAKRDHFGKMINPSKFGDGMGMQFHEDNDEEKKDHFGNMNNPAKFGAGTGLQFHEDGEKEKQDHFGNMINPSEFGAWMGMQFHEDVKEKQDTFGDEISPTRSGAGMGMAYRWSNPSHQWPYPGAPIYCPEPRLPSHQVPIIGVGPEIGYDQPYTCCPCTVQCCHQYEMKLRQLRKEMRLRFNELQDRKSGGDLGEGGGLDESFGSWGQLYT